MEVDFRAVHADIGDHPAGRDEFLAQTEGRRHADRLDRGIDALAIREIANQAHDVFTRAVERMRGAEPARDSRAVVVEIDHDRSEEHTSELQSLMRISYAVFC